jgi:hypothetical protein
LILIPNKKILKKDCGTITHNKLIANLIICKNKAITAPTNPPHKKVRAIKINQFHSL